MNGRPNARSAVEPTSWPGFGLPEDRLARLAARRAFVDMKGCFMRAAAVIEGERAVLIQRTVRQSGDAIDLWRLRQAVLEALPASDAGAMHREELRRQLAMVFPDEGPEAGFAPFCSTFT